MDSNKEVKPLKKQFDFADVPSWYVLCHNSQCPMQTTCLRFLAWIRQLVKSYGYEWEVPFDCFCEAYEYHHLMLNVQR